MTKQRHPRIEHWDDERRLGNSLIVTLAAGWAFRPHADQNQAEHVDGFDTIRTAMTAVRKSRPCTCLACTEPKRRTTP